MMCDKAEEFAVGPENQMEFCGEPKSPSSFKEKLNMDLLPVKQEEEVEFYPGDSCMSMEDDDPETVAMAALGMMPAKSSLSLEEINADLKHQLMKEIRRFGRKYENIFRLLKGVQGPPEVRRQFVEFTIREAARFKRKDLINRLEMMLEKNEI